MPNSARKPIVIVTRKLPDVVETRMRELFDARLNVDDAPMTASADHRGAEDRRRAGAHGHGPHRPRRDFAGRPAASPDRQLRHRRRQHRSRHRAQPRHHRHQYAGRADRGHRRHDDGADPRRPAPAGRGRRLPQGPEEPLERLVADLDARPPHLRQAPRHHRHGPHRPGRGAPRQGVRPADPLPQPPPRLAGRGEGARGDVLGEPRPDADAGGHRLRQLSRTRRGPITCCRRGGCGC